MSGELWVVSGEKEGMEEGMNAQSAYGGPAADPIKEISNKERVERPTFNVQHRIKEILNTEREEYRTFNIE